LCWNQGGSVRKNFVGVGSLYQRSVMAPPSNVVPGEGKKQEYGDEDDFKTLRERKESDIWDKYVTHNNNNKKIK
jgi:hypothetical protein